MRWAAGFVAMVLTGWSTTLVYVRILVLRYATLLLPSCMLQRLPLPNGMAYLLLQHRERTPTCVEERWREYAIAFAGP